jgi:hypothetical protein
MVIYKEVIVCVMLMYNVFGMKDQSKSEIANS